MCIPYMHAVLCGAWGSIHSDSASLDVKGVNALVAQQPVQSNWTSISIPSDGHSSMGILVSESTSLIGEAHFRAEQGPVIKECKMQCVRYVVPQTLVNTKRSVEPHALAVALLSWA